MKYRDRADAGSVLAGHLGRYANRDDVTVLGLVRGGVPVAVEVAARLGAPIDALVVRKLGVPWAPEVAFGAVGPGGVIVVNPDIVNRLDDSEVAGVVHAERQELDRRQRLYRGARPPLDLTGRTALIVDDGLATGATARAAVEVARRLGAAEVVVAVPVGATESVADLRAVADEVVCPLVPDRFGSVSLFYDEFAQVTDAEVIDLL